MTGQLQGPGRHTPGDPGPCRERDVVLFVNDSLFSYLIARPLIAELGARVSAAVFSTRLTSSPRRLYAVFRRVHWRYFVYRSIVDVGTRLNRLRRVGCVRALIQERGIPALDTEDLAALFRAGGIPAGRVGVALNFDQILSQPLLDSFERGVLNFHASKLPFDKGISPVLWAFARGDATLWGSVYRMRPEIDCGELLAQFETSVRPGDSAFSAYARVCTEGGSRLASVVANTLEGLAVSIGESREGDGSYHGWPGREHAEMLSRSSRALWHWLDLKTFWQAGSSV